MELERSIEISNKHGLHARASTRLAQVAKQFTSAIAVSTPTCTTAVDAKSILGILTLGAEKGQTLHIRVTGDDADKAMEALVQLIEAKFGED